VLTRGRKRTIKRKRRRKRRRREQGGSAGWRWAARLRALRSPSARKRAAYKGGCDAPANSESALGPGAGTARWGAASGALTRERRRTIKGKRKIRRKRRREQGVSAGWR